MVEAKTQLLVVEAKKSKKQNRVKIETYLKPSWVLASTNICESYNFFGIEHFTIPRASMLMKTVIL
jgi:hypothetical protein